MPSRRERKVERKNAAIRRFQSGNPSKKQFLRKPLDLLRTPENPILAESVLKLVEFGMPKGIAEDLLLRGIPTIAELKSKTEDEMLEWPKYGAVRVGKITKALTVAREELEKLLK